MKLLVLGGTVFLGRHLVEAALNRGDEVTLFNRGRTNPDLYRDVEQIRGDRDGDLSGLRRRQWDAAIDTSGYLPRVVRASVEALAASVDHYTFVSTISVYADFTRAGITEEAPLATLANESVDELNDETYGPLKALCETVAEQSMPGRVLIVRPGLIVGPCDPTNRFTYWVRRLARGGDVLAPGNPERQVQLIDARDLAAWMLRMADSRATGTYNATGPDYQLTMGGMLEACARAAESDAHLVWVGDDKLLEGGVVPFSELPLWIPERDSDETGFMSVDIRKATVAGLAFRPLLETAHDTLAWDRAVASGAAPPAPALDLAPRAPGLDADHEKRLLSDGVPR